MDSFISNLELFSAIYTFLGQYKFYQAIAIEALPGRDPYLLDLQYNYRVAANLDYSIAALINVLQVYLNNINTVLTAEETNMDIEISTQTTAEATDLNTLLASNKTSQLLKTIPPREITTVRILRQAQGKRWQRVTNGQIIKVYPGKTAGIKVEGSV